MDKFTSIFILLVLFTCTQCADDSEDPDNNLGAFDTACTQEFVIQTITVLDKNGSLIPFDIVEVRRRSDGFIYRFDTELSFDPNYSTSGTYILMTDKYYDELDEDGTDIIFKGIQSAEVPLVVTEEYVFRRGACHIEMVSGPEVIVIN